MDLYRVIPTLEMNRSAQISRIQNIYVTITRQKAKKKLETKIPLSNSEEAKVQETHSRGRRINPTRGEIYYASSLNKRRVHAYSPGVNALPVSDSRFEPPANDPR